MPRFATATLAGSRLASSDSRDATSFSSSSLNRVAAASPTIASAPVAWWRCVRMYLTGARSAGAAASLSRFSRAWASEWSISVLTHERGPRSKSITGFAAICRCPCALRLQLEARDGALELLRHGSEVADRARGLLRAPRGLPRDLQDVLHVLRDLVGRVRLRLR